MAGTVLITGANGSLGLAAVSYLLSAYPTHTLLLTVRDPSPSDPNSAKLHNIIAKHPNANVRIETIDLASTKDVAAFAQEVAASIRKGTYPKLTAIICNAMTWSLNSGVQFSKDGLELTMAVNTLSHFDLVLRLLGHMEDNARIVFLSSDTHWPGKAGFEVYPPVIPGDLEALVKYEKDVAGEEAGRGFQRYGLSKLVGVMLMYELNRRLQKVRSNTSLLEYLSRLDVLTRSHSSQRCQRSAFWRSTQEVFSTLARSRRPMCLSYGGFSLA
jgi:NAD(P)-dependent dehydrogenase (short-subunit alcohol dehydrogenase family)